MRRLVLFLILIAAGCRTTKDMVIRADRSFDVTTMKFGDFSADLLNQSPFEHRILSKDDSFFVRVAELDDDGLFFRQHQIDVIHDQVLQESGANGAIIIVFVHGWKHNGLPCDDNLSCFREVLRNLTVAERKLNPGQPRTIEGVYVSWRGLAQCDEPAKELSFWRRKATAQDIGASEARELLHSLQDVHDNLLEQHPTSRLVIVGHSFGAAVVYNAVAPDLRQNFFEELRMAKPGSKLRRIEGFGNLVVLVNPAFEAQQLKDLRTKLDQMKAQNIRFADDQPPILAIISSKVDVPTHVFFPIGQTLNLLIQPLLILRGPAYWLRHGIAVGNHPSYWTHVATQVEPWPTNAAATAGERPGCFQGKLPDSYPDCSCSEPVSRALELRLLSLDLSAAARSLYEPNPNYGNVKLTEVGSLRLPHNPYLIISAAREVTSGHTDVFNPTIVSLIGGLITHVDTQPSLPAYHASK